MRKAMWLSVVLVAGCPAGEKGGSTPPADKPPTEPTSKPTDHPPPAAAGKPFSGLVKLGEGIDAKDVGETDVLFIMARESQGGGKAGRLVAVQKHQKVAFPFRYEISGSDLMVVGMPFTGPFIVYARLDRDGDPMTKDAKDLYGTFAGDVQNGQEGAHLVLENKKEVPMMAAPPKAATPGPAPKGPASVPSKAMPKMPKPPAPASQPAK